MDQDLYDIDPEYRKKYDADMKKYAKEMEAKAVNISTEMCLFISSKNQSKTPKTTKHRFPCQ